MEGLRIKHLPTKQEGFILKIYTPTGMRETLQMKLDNEEIYFAPSAEFKIISCDFENGIVL